MSTEQNIQQQLEAAQTQIYQLAAERDDARQTQTQLQGQIEQQQRYIAKLEAQTTQLQWIINTSPATTYSCEVTPPYSCTYVSKSLETILGYTPEEFKAEPDFWEQRLHPEDAPGVLAVIPTLFEQGKLQHDYRIRHRDGHYVWIRDALVLLRDTQGVPQQMVGFFTDINEQKRLDAERKHTEQLVEQELQRIAKENCQFRETLTAQETTYRHLFDGNPQPMWVYDLESLRFLAVNDAAIAKYGYSRAEFLAMTIADIRPPEEVPRLLENVAQVNSGLDMAGVWQHSLRDGRTIQVEIVSYVLEFEGRRAELVMAQDVTERLAAEQALQDLNRSLEQTVADRTAALQTSQAELHDILNSSPAKIFVEDLQGRYIFVNQTFLQLFNCRPEDILGKTTHEFFPPDIADAFRANDRLLLEQGGVQQFEEIVRIKGEDRTFLSNKFLLRDAQGEVYALCGMATDITDRKALEAALQDSYAHQQAILAALPDHVFRVNREGRYLDCYPSGYTAEISGLETLVGRTITEVLPPEVAQAHLHRIEQALSTQTVQVSEQVVEIDGMQRVREVRVAPCDVDEVVFVIRDITDRKQVEIALQESQQMLQVVLDAAPIPIFWKDHQLVYQGGNRAAAQNLGLASTSDLVGLRDDQLPWNQEDAQIFQAGDRQILESGQSLLNQIYHLLLQDGSEMWLECSKVPLRNAAGTIIGILGTAQNITNRKQVEIALRKSEERYRQLFNSIEEGFCIAEVLFDDAGIPYEHRFLETNPAFSRHCRLASVDPVGKTASELIPGIAPFWNDLYAQVLATGEPIRQDIRSDVFDRWFEVLVCPVGKDAPHQVFVLFADVSDRKQAEIALQNLSDRLRMAVQTGGYGIWEWNLGQELIWDDQMHVIFGLQNWGQVTTYDDWRVFVHPDDIAPLEAKIAPALAGEAPFYTEFRITRPDGERRWIQAVAQVQHDAQGNPIRMVGINCDVTERKQAEIALQNLSDRLSLALEAGELGVWSWDLDQQLYWDAALCRMYGIPETSQFTPWQVWRSKVHHDDIERVEALLQAAIKGAPYTGIEFRIWRTDGELRWIQSFAQVQRDAQGNPIRMVGINCDVTAHKQAELALIAYAEQVEDLYNNAPCGYYSLDAEGCITQINNTALHWLDAPPEAVLGQPITEFLTVASQRIVAERRAMLAQPDRVKSLEYEIVLRGCDGGQMAVLVSEEVQKDAEGTIVGSRAILTDIRQRLKTERIVQQQLTQENLLRQITARIRQSLDLHIIFETACNEIRQALGVDRVAIFRFFPHSNFNDGEFVAESMFGQYPSAVAAVVHDHCFGEKFATLYTQGRYYAVTDIEAGKLSNCHEDILRQFQVRANLVVPLVQGENALWGLLCIHQCSGPRVWRSSEIDLAQQLANQLAIAINQASLYQRLQAELSVRQQAEAQILQQLEQQRTLARLIKTVRESLAVDDILSNATQQVKALLQCNRVIIFRLYPDGRSCIVEEAVSPEFATLKDQNWEDETWSDEILELYWQGRPRIVPDVMQDRWTDCLIDYSQAGQIRSKIVAPILQEAHASERHRWVDAAEDRKPNKLWGIIVAHACREKRMWQEPEAELLQQVANSVAIAIQQASLFEQLQQELGVRQIAEQQLAARNQQLSIINAELERATRLKDEFLANMSHELRTPLNAILGMTEGLQEEVFGPLTDRQRRSLTTIESSSNHLLSLINDVLDVAKIEADQLELDYAAVNVSLLCNSSLTLIKQQAHKKCLHLETHVPNNLPDLYGDDRRLRQTLVNLLSNAVKFTPEGGRITVTASYTPLAPEAIAKNRGLIHPQRDPSATVGTLTLRVADTGIGISPENAKKLFQPFIQIDSALNRQHEGTGLGLALVKRITEMHGGKVELTSEVGSGSCFTLKLPIMAIPSGCFPAAASTAPIDAPPPLDTAAPPLILLAEDNEANINTTAAYLTAKGYHLIVANDGTEAVKLAINTNPDLILMDIQMPQLDGLEAIRQIRQNPDLAYVPIVAITALAMPEDRERCLAAGANEYISKPIRLRQLSHMIQTLLANRSVE